MYINPIQPSLTVEDDANDPNSNMLEAQDENMHDAQQTNHTPAKVSDHFKTQCPAKAPYAMQESSPKK